MRILFLSVLCWGANLAHAQSSLELDPSYSAERLVKEVFATDRCETIFNVRQIGNNPDGIGYFEAPEEIVGFSRGIIISTGKIEDAAGPNKQTNTGSRLSGPTPDPDLDLVTRGGIFDRSGVEFDFVPLESVITFRYVFASEEYCEYVGSSFNDIFGFFVSGPGFEGPYDRGAVNIAQVPGTNQAVNINNISYRNNKSYYLDNEFLSIRTEANCSGERGDGSRFQTIEYDGQTVTLTATIKVQACQTYHIRLLVADVSDSDRDSAVFLEAGSFDLGASVTLQGEGDENSPVIAYEGCAPGILRVVRGEDSSLDRAQNVTYRVSRNSQATDSLDFDAGSGTVTIPAGATFAEVPIQALADTTVEGDESAWLILDVPCACFTDSVELIIREAQPMEIGDERPFYYCAGGGSTLSAGVQGGVPPFAYNWNFGSTEAEPVVTETLPDTVSLTVTDACGQSLTWRASTELSDPPVLVFPEREITACWGDEQRIPTNLVGHGPFTLTYQIDAGPTRVFTFPQEGSVEWPVYESGIYRVIAVQDLACGVRTNESVKVNFFKPVINPAYTNPHCAGEANGSISAGHLPTVSPYLYRVNGEPSDGLELDGLAPGNYVLEVIDALGCRDSTDLELVEPEYIQPVEVNCDQLRRPPISLSATGGVPPYQYSADGEEFYNERDFWKELRAGNYYELTIRDVSGCEITQSEFFFPRAATRPIALPSFIPQISGEPTDVQLIYRVPTNQIFSYSWQPAELFDCPTCPNPELLAPFTQDINLVIEDIYGCTDSLSTYVAVDGRTAIFVPNTFTPDGDGNNDYLSIFANAGLVERVMTFRVFTRWGEEVWADVDFPPNSAQRGWNGQLGGRPANPGTYVWVAEVKMFDGDIRRRSGSVTLLPQ